MTVRVTCPSCGRGLLAQESALGSRATCPACLAEIPVSETERAAGAVQTARRESGPSCARCGRDVESVWMTCPWCEEPLRGRAPRAYGRPDLDVRRDEKGTSCFLIALASVGGLGVAFYGFGALAAFAQTGSLGPVVVLAVFLLFLAGVVTLVVFVRSPGRPGTQVVRRVVIGTLAVVGTVIASVLALFVFLFVVCIAAFSLHH